MVSSLIVTEGVPDMTTSPSILFSAFRVIGSSINGLAPSLYKKRLFKAWYPRLDTVIRNVDDLIPLKANLPSISVRVKIVSFPAINFTVAAIMLVPVESFTTPLTSRFVCAMVP